MTWTNKYPTEPGFYWLRNYWIKGFHYESPGPAIIRMNHNLTFYGFDLIGDERDYNKWDLISAEWYGPIEPPGERKYQLCVMCGREADPRYELLHTCGPIEPPE